MKKLFVTLFLMISFLITTSGQFTGIGGGITLSSSFRFHDQSMEGNKSGNTGLSLKSEYKISEPFRVSPSFTFFSPHVTNGPLSNQTISSIMFDINGKYILNPADKIEFYGIAGFDIFFAKNKYTSEGSPSTKDTDNALGVNLGIGTSVKIAEKLDIYGEAKYVFNNKYNQFMINAGLLVGININRKHENKDQ